MLAARHQLAFQLMPAAQLLLKAQLVLVVFMLAAQLVLEAFGLAAKLVLAAGT